MNRVRYLALSALMMFTASGAALAGVFSTNNPSGAAGTSVNLIVSFAGDGETTDAQWDAGVGAPGGLTFSAPMVLVPGSACVVLAGGNTIRISPPSGGVVPITSTVTAYCSFNVAIAAGAAPGTRNLTTILLECADPAPSFNACTASGSVTVTAAGPADVSPNVTFTPNPLNLTGSPTATGTLTATPAGGTGAATTTASCVDDAGGPVFTITPATLTFTGTTTTSQNFTVSCPTAAAPTSGTITCSQNQSDGTNPAATVITVNCPATAAGPGTAPTVSPLPATTLSAGATGGIATGNVPVTVATAGTAPGSLALACTIPAGANSFTITGGANRTINAPATVGDNPPPIGVSCVRTAAAATATLTCTQNATPDPDPAPLTATITCPAGAGAGADTSPTIAFTPNPLTLTGSGTATGTLTATPAGGTGAATTTAMCVDDAGGPVFTIAPASLTFTGTTGTSQNFTVSCPTAATATSGTITCSQNHSDGTSPAPTVVTVNCPATAAPADVSPNLTYNPPSGGSLGLAGGAMPTGTIVVTPSGGTGAASTTVGGCSFAPNTAVFTITPATLTFVGTTTTPQNFTVGCTSQAAAVNSVLTCTETQSDGTPGPTARTFNVTCPAAAVVPPPGSAQATAVPTLSPAGKLIAIFSVLGLGLLGFAVTRRA